jgi:hypothetical protein
MYANYTGTRLKQDGSGFDKNRASPGRFYNLTFDLALKRIYTPKTARVGCFLQIFYTNQVKLVNSTFGPKFKTVGPMLFDANKAFYGANDGARFELDCYEQDPITLESIGGNATIAIDNVVWSQYGREVGNV